MKRFWVTAFVLLAGCNSASDVGSSSTTSYNTTTSPTTIEVTTTTSSSVPNTAAPRTTMRVTTAPTGAVSTEPTQVAAPSRSEACSAALVGLQAVGLPRGFGFYCSAEKTQGHAGLTGWNYNGESFVAINPATGNHPGVGAHEACHAQDFATKGSSSEASADACARDHGYPNPYENADDTLVGEKPTVGPLLWLQFAVLVVLLLLITSVLSLMPAIRRRLTHHHHRKDQA